jgi:hypothetical protein
MAHSERQAEILLYTLAAKFNRQDLSPIAKSGVERMQSKRRLHSYSKVV